MNTTFIYELFDPIKNIPFYIGKSNTPYKRLKTHISDIYYKNKSRINYDKIKVLESILSRNKKPILNILDEVKESEWQFWEKHYISLYRSWGFNLTNLTVGGDGITDLTGEIGKKISIAIKGHTVLPKTKLLQSKKGKQKYKCNFCSKEIDLRNLKLHHNNNCKYNPNLTKEEKEQLQLKKIISSSLGGHACKGKKKKKQERRPCTNCGIIYSVSKIEQYHDAKCQFEKRVCKNIKCNNEFIINKKYTHLHCSSYCAHQSNKDKIYINNGVINMFFDKNKKLPNGFLLGMIKRKAA